MRTMRGMPKRPIPIIPGIPYHVTQRASHRQFILESDHAKAVFASLLAAWAVRERVIVHAFVLMNNHIHLGATETLEGGLRRMIGCATQAMSRWLNANSKANGPNWERRFYASPMDEVHALAAAAYIERNPVAAGIVRDAWDWRWSSAAYHVGRSSKPRLLTSSETVPGGMSCDEWARTLRGSSDEQVGAALHAAARCNSVLADQSWIDRIEQAIGRPIAPRPRGRPLQGK